MYIVTISNNGIETTIHDGKEKLHSGKVVKGINTIDSFTFSMLPSNVGFNLINEFKTLVTVYNTNKRRYDFIGRVLYPETTMDENGLITKEVTCESILAYLCDSQQIYKNTQNWTVSGLLQHLLTCHNSQVEEYKRFKLGEVTVTDPNDNLYIGIQRTNTWEAINEKLIKQLGGELRYRVEEDGIYLDYLEQLGETRITPIALSINMKSITREKDPTAYVTRLIPLGCKLKDAEGNETEERLGIEDVNDGYAYIDDETAISVYGIHVGYVEFDDVTSNINLLNKGRAWMIENNKVQIKYSITALDLSLIGLAIDDLDVCDYHPIQNDLLGIDDVARIIKKTIDVCEEVKSTIEMGDNFKSLSDIQREQAQAVQNIQKIEQVTNQLQNEVASTNKTVSDLKTEYDGFVTDEELVEKTETAKTQAINESTEILLSALKEYVETSDYNAYRETVSAQLSIMADEIAMNFTTTTEQITNVDGDLQSKFTELYKYISFSANGITIGDKTSGLVLTLDNDMIVFSKNGVAFGRWDGTDFYTGNIIVEVNERAQFGNFAFVPREDGSLAFLKVADLGKSVSILGKGLLGKMILGKK